MGNVLSFPFQPPPRPQNTDLALDGGRELVSGSIGVNNFNNRKLISSQLF